jgi:hypothetical protein
LSNTLLFIIILKDIEESIGLQGFNQKNLLGSKVKKLFLLISMAKEGNGMRYINEKAG